MRIYNKKGFVWGLCWTLAGAFCLYRDIVSPDDFFPQQIKSVALSVLMLAMGLTGFIRAFSRSATQQDRIEALDERNRLVRLKTDALTLRILGYVQLFCLALGILAYAFTQNIVFGCLFLFSGLSITLTAVIAIAAAIYYEKRV